MIAPELAKRDAPVPAGTEPRPRMGHSSWTTLALVGGLTVLGAAIRLVVARQSLFADELSTYWISAQHGLHGVISLMYGTGPIKHAEITPPMYFVAAWAAMQLGHGYELLRLPSLLAGILTIPLVYALGLRTVGRRAAVIGCALTALSPFQIYYSTEARAYAIMMLLLAASTIALVVAVRGAGLRWWALYAVCSAAVIYTHYTGVFVLAAQFVWALVFHPRARRELLLATVGAAVLVAPWLPGLVNDYRSPTTKILSGLSPFSPSAVWVDVGHWALGYPYAKLARLTQLPGWPALGLIAAGAACGLVGAALAGRPRRSTPEPRPRSRGLGERVRAADPLLVLMVALALSTPVCEALQSAVSTHTFGIRNLAASWIPTALLFGVLLSRPGLRVRVVATALAVGGFALAGLGMLSNVHQRPEYRQAADYVDGAARPDDVVIDETGFLSPGPLTALDLYLKRPLRVVRALSPEERDHPFGLTDPYVSLTAASAQAERLPGAGRIFVVGAAVDPALSASGAYRRIALRDYHGMPVSLFARAGAGG